MGRLVSAITGNPALLLWIVLGSLALGGVSGAGGAWYVQGLRLDALRAEYDSFVGVTRALGESAAKVAAVKAEADKKRKEISDATYQDSIARLTADNKRLRDARAGSSIVPAGPHPAGRVDLACFDRAELERALQYHDAAVSGLLGEGDADALALRVARQWASGIGSGADSPAISPP